MPQDIRIYPSQSSILFTGSSNAVEASITLDNLGRLNLSGSQILFGPGKNDIYIGDGTSSANILFEKDGAIRSETGTNSLITLGSGETRLNISGSIVNITSSNLIVGPFTSSFANIANGIITASLNSNNANLTNITSSVINSTLGIFPTITSSNISINNGVLSFSNASQSQATSISTDALGNLILDSTSGSVYLSKNKQDVYIGDGTSSANIIFDVAGAIKGETGKNVFLTIGSSDTRLIITGSSLNIGPFTASYALIQDGIITASAISASDGVSFGSVTVSSSITSSTVSSTTGSFQLLRPNNINLPLNGGIFFTSSLGTIGGLVNLDPLGNLQLNSVSGSVLIGKNTGFVYVGDGISPGNLVFDQGGALYASDGGILRVGQSSSFLEITGSQITFQKNRGLTVFRGPTEVSSSLSISGSIFLSGSLVTDGFLFGRYTGVFTGDGSGLLNVPIAAATTSGSFSGSFSGSHIGTYIGNLFATSSVSMSLQPTGTIFSLTSGSSTPFLIQYTQPVATSNLNFGFNTGSTTNMGTFGAAFDVRATAIIVNPSGAAWNENLRLPSASNGYSNISMGGIISGSGPLANMFSMGTSPTGATGSQFYIGYSIANPSYALTINTSSLVTINSVSGAIFSPTSSGVPTFSGSDGQHLFGNVGGNQVMFVWMAGRWRSSSLA
jgi:hypothetical protein